MNNRTMGSGSAVLAPRRAVTVERCNGGSACPCAASGGGTRGLQYERSWDCVCERWEARSRDLNFGVRHRVFMFKKKRIGGRTGEVLRMGQKRQGFSRIGRAERCIIGKT
jgi:hypothetical protein